MGDLRRYEAAGVYQAARDDVGLKRGAECPMRVGECKLGGRVVVDVVSDLLASLSGDGT